MPKKAATPIAGELVERDADYNRTTQLLVAEFGEGLHWDPDHYTAAIAAEMRRGCEAFLRAGRLLVVARGCASHGEWNGMLERLRLDRPQAHRMMEAAKRVAALPNVATSQHLIEAAGSPSKLIELLSLPEDQFAQLAEEGETGELSLDDVATMTVRDLREAVREARADLQSKDDVAAQTDERVRKLEEDLAKARREARKATPNDVLSTLRSRIDAVAIGIEAEITASGDVGSLRRWVGELTEHAVNNDLDVLPYLAGVFAQVERALHVLRADYGIPRAAVGDPAEEARMTLGQGA